jgi:hypothetical protein
MHFAENYFTTTGSRVFAINIENNVVINNFDIFNEVKYRSAIVKDFSTNVTDGVLTIKFNPTANRVSIAALELFNVTDYNSSVLVNNKIPVPLVDSLLSYPQKIAVYPNPNGGSIYNLSLANFGKSETGRVTVTNAWGKPVQTDKITTDYNGNINVPISFRSALPRGVYIINVVLPSGKMHSKLLVQ